MTLSCSTHDDVLQFLRFRHGSLFSLLRNGLTAFGCNIIINKSSTSLVAHFRKVLSLHQNGLPTDRQGLERLIQQTEDQLFKKHMRKPLLVYLCLILCRLSFYVL